MGDISCRIGVLGRGDAYRHLPAEAKLAVACATTASYTRPQTGGAILLPCLEGVQLALENVELLVVVTLQVPDANKGGDVDDKAQQPRDVGSRV